MDREIICIMCPLGCRMKVQVEGQEVIQVEGEGCKKGLKYAQQEVTFPGRILTTTVSTDSPEMPLLPVRSNKALPKEKLMACMKQISKHSVTGSVQLGQAVIENILGLCADIVACRTVPLKIQNTGTG
jgi:CxxC motif-containing protein